MAECHTGKKSLSRKSFRAQPEGAELSTGCRKCTVKQAHSILRGRGGAVARRPGRAPLPWRPGPSKRGVEGAALPLPRRRRGRPSPPVAMETGARAPALLRRRHSCWRRRLAGRTSAGSLCGRKCGRAPPPIPARPARLTMWQPPRAPQQQSPPQASPAPGGAREGAAMEASRAPQHQQAQAGGGDQPPQPPPPPPPQQPQPQPPPPAPCAAPPQGGPGPGRGELSLPGILHFIQHEWARFEAEKSRWEAERAELQVGALPGPRRRRRHLAGVVADGTPPAPASPRGRLARLAAPAPGRGRGRGSGAGLGGDLEPPARVYSGVGPGGSLGLGSGKRVQGRGPAAQAGVSPRKEAPESPGGTGLSEEACLGLDRGAAVRSTLPWE
ncbi:basic salivary proline-rich protein 4-like [Tiliqua scincoides]|uniref:basic salivary proline-rich protein 4-like n=1 Tax=Tiliqua scincoides TaxID=71010 RepID=UPI003461E115